MGIVQRKLTQSFKDFVESEQSSGVLLIVCTIVSLVLTNSILGGNYLSIWHQYIAGLSVEHWINDGLMAIFFLLIGLELKRELYSGELSNFKNALLPITAAAGGVVVPALIHFSLNVGTPTQAGIGIPMATDIAFALGGLALLGKRVPASLKIFLTALAVMDDLAAIIVIAVFYTAQLSIVYLAASLLIFGFLLVLNNFLRVMSLWVYLIGGIVMWYCMLASGVHATISGVLLAFTIPYSAKDEDADSPSYKLEHFLHRPVAFGILPIFALANTGITIGLDSLGNLMSSNSLGIALGLIIGKPVGIAAASFAAVKAGICRLPEDLSFKHIIGAGMFGGIGFTMSIFITNLAFPGSTDVINTSKLAILGASLAAGILGYIWLKIFGQPKPTDEDLETYDYLEEENS